MKINNKQIKSLVLLSLVGSGLGKEESSNNQSELTLNSLPQIGTNFTNIIQVRSDGCTVDSCTVNFRDLVEAVGWKIANNHGTYLVDCGIDGWLNWKEEPRVKVTFSEGSDYGFESVGNGEMIIGERDRGTVINNSGERVNHTYEYALTITDKTETRTKRGFKHGASVEASANVDIPVPGVSGGKITVGASWEWDSSTEDRKEKVIEHTNKISQEFEVEPHSTKTIVLNVRSLKYKIEVKREVDFSGSVGYWFNDKINLNGDDDWHWEWFVTPRSVVEHMFKFPDLPSELTKGYWEGEGDVAKYEEVAIVEGLFGINYQVVISEPNSTEVKETIVHNFREFETNIEVPSK